MIEDDFGEILKKKWKEAVRTRGRVNILIAGKTGVGKSTLVNSVFDGDLAATGMGRPVTQHIREISKEGIPVSIFDTRGLELDDYDASCRELFQFLTDRKRREDPNEHVHAAWLCIGEDSRRVEQAESKLMTFLSGNAPSLAVITKACADRVPGEGKGFRDVVQESLPEARNVMRVRAKAITLDDGHMLEPIGLVELIDATNELIPEGQRNALAAAQKVSPKLKLNRAHAIVAASAIAAAAIGTVPIPFSDAALLVPTQIGMLASISVVWGLSLNSGFLSTIVTSAAGTTGSTYAGRVIAGNLLKLIPGGGSVVGGLINGTTAALLTTAMGEAYAGALFYLTTNSPDRPLGPDEIAEEFKRRLLQEVSWWKESQDTSCVSKR
jgi:uncharacterized protein (DUF697 family)